MFHTLQHTVLLHKGISSPMALSQSGTICCLQRLQSHIQHPDYFLPHLYIVLVRPPFPKTPTRSRSFPRLGGFSNSPMSSVNLSQYLRWPTTFPGLLWPPSIPSHLSLTNGFIFVLDLAASSMICKSNGMRPTITSMASVGVDLSAPECILVVNGKFCLLTKKQVFVWVISILGLVPLALQLY